MEQFGVISTTDGDSATVALKRHLVCESCGKCGILSGADKRETTVKALNPIGAEPGQRVMLESDDRRVLAISFLLYIVPLIGLVTGIFLWLRIAAVLELGGSQDLAAVGAGFLLMAIVFVAIRLFDRRVRDNPAYKPVITGLVIDDETAPEPCGEEDS